MKQVLLCVLFLCLLATDMSAESVRSTKRMLDLLKPGATIGVSFEDDLKSIIITVLENDASTIMRDAEEIAFEQVMEKYPSVAKRREASLRKFIAQQKQNPDVDIPEMMGRIGFAIEPSLSDFDLHGELMAIGANFIQFRASDGKRYALNTDGLRCIVWVDQVDVAIGAIRVEAGGMM